MSHELNRVLLLCNPKEYLDKRICAQVAVKEQVQSNYVKRLNAGCKRDRAERLARVEMERGLTDVNEILPFPGDKTNYDWNNWRPRGF